jgi:hypothetical protein
VIQTSHDPFRPPDWRWQRCEHLLHLGRRPSRRRDDAATWAGWQYLAALRRCQDDRDRAGLCRHYPALDAAHHLRVGKDNLCRWGVEGYLLGGVEPAAVDERFRLQAGTTLAYSEQFFDVLGILAAHDYLINVVIGLHRQPLKTTDAATFLRLYGLMGGRYVVDAVYEYYADPLRLDLLGEVGPEDRPRLLRRLAVHTAILARCVGEASLRLDSWVELERLAERVGREQSQEDDAVRGDVSDCLTAACEAEKSSPRCVPDTPKLGAA